MSEIESESKSPSWVESSPLLNNSHKNERSSSHSEDRKKGCCVIVVTWLSWVSLLFTLATMTSQILSFFLYSISLIDIIAKSFSISFCLMLLFVELRLLSIVDDALVSRSWIVRGLIYIYIGVIVLQQYEDLEWSSSIFISLTLCISGGMLLVGAIYLISGLLCLKYFYDHSVHE